MSKSDLVARLSAIIETEDADACAECYVNDAELISPIGTMNGKQEIRDFFQGWFDSYSDFDIQDELTEVDDGVACESVSRFTHTAGTMLPTGEVLEATGRRLRVEAREHYAFEGDLIKRQRMEFDLDDMVSQLMR